MGKISKTEKPIILFSELVQNGVAPEKLRSHLTNLYCEYSRLLIKELEENNYKPEDADDQLYYLHHIIRTLDPHSTHTFNDPIQQAR